MRGKSTSGQAASGMRGMDAGGMEESSRLEAIASRLEAIASRLEAIASRLEAIALNLYTVFIIYIYELSGVHVAW